jgi:hypothetical protein
MNMCMHVCTVGIVLFSIVKGVQRCLTFWYHMYGSDIGTLNVLVDGTSVWTRKGDQGNGWKKAYITIRRTTHYKVESLHLQYVRSSTHVYVYKFTDLNALYIKKVCKKHVRNVACKKRIVACKKSIVACEKRIVLANSVL